MNVVNGGFKRPLSLLPFCLVTLALPLRSAQAVQADSFVDSVGVNVHLSYVGSVYYDNFPLVQSSLSKLGARHVRDVLADCWQAYYDRHNQLGKAGIKGVFISQVGQSLALLRSFPGLVSSSFEAYEGPNEYDGSSDPAWANTLRNFLPTLYEAAKSGAATGLRYPVYGPSLTLPTDIAILGDVSQFFDFGNLHNYPGGRNPGTVGWGPDGYGSISWSLREARPLSGGKPILTTETGYWNDPSLTWSVTPALSARYIPRLALEQYRAGLPRTYVFELCDVSLPGVSESYGLLNADGSAKPAFGALKGLMNLLADPGPSFSTTALSYELTGATPDVHQLLFQKRDGSYYLALWVELPGYDVVSKQVINVPSQDIAVHVNGAVSLTGVYQWHDDGSTTLTPGAMPGGVASVIVSDSLTVLRFVPKV